MVIASTNGDGIQHEKFGDINGIFVGRNCFPACDASLCYGNLEDLTDEDTLDSHVKRRKNAKKP